MNRARWWLSLAALAGVASGCSDDGESDGTQCGKGTTKVDGVCVAASGDGDADGTPGGVGDGDGSPVGDGDGEDGSDTVCGAGTVEVDGECVPAPAPDKILNGFTVTELRFDTKGRTLMGLESDPAVSVFHPVDVTVSVRYDGDPATIPLIVGLGEEGASGATGDGFCMLGGISLEHTGTGELTATKRMFLNEDCLAENVEDEEPGIPVATRVMNPVVMVDPDELLQTSSALPRSLVFSAAKQADAILSLTAYNEALRDGETPEPLPPETLSLATCMGGSRDGAGSCALSVDVRETTGVDFELSNVGLESSVLVLNKCFDTQAELAAYAQAAPIGGETRDMPTGYVCNRSIVRGLDEAGEPLPFGDTKDFTYGAADLELDTTVTSFGLADSPVKSADELMGMGSETDDGFQLNVAPEDIANNALASDEAYQIRYYLRPASVGIYEPDRDASIAAAIARAGGVSTLVAEKKLLPIYLHAQGEQAKADEEGSPSGQTPTTPEETISIPQAPTEYNHGLYVENDCGRFNDPRRPGKNPEVDDCDAAVNPRDELLYGAYKDETQFFVVACLDAAEGAELPASDDADNNCTEQAVRIARVVPREAQWAARNPESDDPNPFAADPDDVASPGFTQDHVFAAGDAADAYAANYDYDQAIGNEHMSFNAHAHTRSSLTLQNGASTDNEAKMTLRSGTLGFSMDLVRIWAQAAARTTIVGSYYDYGLSFFGTQYMGERRELEFHREWDWNVTKKWEKSQSLFVNICWVDVGVSIEGQAGLRLDLDVLSRELPGVDNVCDLGAGNCECATPECSALKTNYPNSEAVGEASVTLTPYGSIKSNIFAAISLQVVRAGAAGELTIVQIGFPAKGAVNFGLVGSVLRPEDATLRLTAWANLRLESVFLRGRLYLFAENQSAKWCKKWGIPYPCGWGWSQFWDQTLASWDGWSYNQLLWASPVYRADLSRNGLSTPQPVFPTGREVKITTVHSNKCLDMYDRWTTQYGCHGESWQRFTFQDLGNGTYRVTGSRQGKCVDVDGASGRDNARIGGWGCHGGDNQKVRLEPVGDAYMIKFVNSGKCLDVPGWSQRDSEILQQWSCHGGTNQLFRITPY